MFSLFYRKLVEFIKNSISKGIFIFAAVIFAGMGNVWGTNYQWRQTDAATDEWEGTSNWYYFLILGWPEAGDYPDGTDDNVYFGGNRPVTIKLNSDINVGDLIFSYQGTSVTSGSETITIDLNGHTLTCNNLSFNNNDIASKVKIIDSSGSSPAGTLTVTGDLNFTAKDHNLTIDNGVTLDVQGSYTPTSGGSITVDGSSSGTIILPPNTTPTGLVTSGATGLTLEIGSTFTWLGTTDSTWTEPSNWQNGSVPTGTNAEIIITASSNNPILSLSTATEYKSLEIESGAEITIKGEEDLTLSTISNAGKIIFADSARTSIMDTTKGSVEYTESATVIKNYGSASDADYYNLFVSTNCELESGNEIIVGNDFTLSDGNKITDGQSINVNNKSYIDGDIKTAHGQYFYKEVELTSSSVTFGADDTYKTTFYDTVTGIAAGSTLITNNVELTKDISNITTLTINGDATLNTTTLGSDNSLETLTVTGNTILKKDIEITSTNANFKNIDSDTTARNLTVNGSLKATKIGETNHINKLTVTENFESTSGESGVLNCNDDLEITKNATFRGNVTAKTVTVGKKTTFGFATSSVTTTGAQNYNDTVVINSQGGELTLIAGTSASPETITFANTIDAYENGGTPTQRAVLNIGSNAIKTNVSFQNKIGSTNPLKSIIVNGKADFSADANSITTLNSQAYNDAVTLSANTTFNASTSEVKFGSTLSGPTSAIDLTIGDTSNASNAKFINTISQIKKLTVYGETTNSGTIETTDIQTYEGAVTNTGTITAPNTGSGTTAIDFKAGYNGTGALKGNATSNPSIVFEGGDVYLENFTHQGDIIVFSNGPVNLKSDFTCQDLEISSGAEVNGGSAKITVENNWINNGGTFTEGSSEVEVSGNVSGTGTNSFNTLKLHGNLAGDHNTSSTSITKLIIEDNTSHTSNITGSNTIGTLICEVPSKTINFTGGTNQEVTNLIINGQDSSTPVTLTGTSTWNIKADDASVTFAQIQNSTSDSTGTTEIHTHLSKNLGGNTRWIFAEDFTWTGSSTTDNTKWNNAENWTISYGTPLATYPAISYPGEYSEDDTVTIPAATNKPVFSGAGITPSDITISKLTLSDGSSKLTLNSAHDIKVKTTSGLSNSGTIVYTNAGRIKDNETTPAAIADNAKGTVEFTAAATTIDDIAPTGTADYFNLEISTSSQATLAGDIKTAGNIKITPELSGGSHSLSSGGTLTTQAALTNLTSLYVTEISSIGDNITSTGNQTFDGAVKFTKAEISLNAGTGRTIFKSTVTGLSVNPTDTTALTLQNVTFYDSISHISTLTVNGTTTNNGTITTSGLQTYADTVSNPGTINIPSIASGTAAEFKNGVTGGIINGAKTSDTDLTPNPDIVISNGDVTFVTFNANGDNLKFTNTDTNQFNPNNQILADVYFSGAGTTLTNSFTAENLYLTSGTLNSGTNNITINNDWICNGGTFTSTSEVEVKRNVTGTSSNAFYSLKLHGNLNNEHTTNSITTLTIAGANGTSTNINSSNTIGSLICEVPSKIITFTKGTTQTINTELTLNGQAAATKITLQSDSASAQLTADQWNIDARNAGTKSVQYVIVQNSKSENLIKTANSVSYGNNINWGIASLFRWTGNGGDANWKTSGNWQTVYKDSSNNDVTCITNEYPGRWGADSIFDDVEIITTEVSNNWPEFFETTNTTTQSLILNKLTVGDSSHSDAILSFISSKDLEISDPNPAAKISNSGKIIYTDSGRLRSKTGRLPIMDSEKGTVQFDTGAVTIEDTSTDSDYYDLIINGTNHNLESTKAIQTANNFTLSAGGSIVQGSTLQTSLAIGGTASIGGPITTAISQTYNGAITLTADTTLKADDIILKNSINCNSANPYAYNITFDGRTKIASTSILNINTQTATFTGTVSNFDATTASLALGENAANKTDGIFKNNITLTSLSVSGTTTLDTNCSSITTTDSQLYAGNLTFANNLTLNGTSINAVSNFTSASTPKDLTLGSGTFNLGTGTFIVSTFTVNNGASFIQTGDNGTNDHDVSKIINNGIMNWDSTSQGGTLSIGAGGISQSDVSHLAVFNKKNVIFTASPVSASGIFYDLTIPNAIELTNNNAIIVRKNFTIDGTGSYVHNGKELHLGSYNFTGTVPSTLFSSESGIITRTNSPATPSVINFGNTYIRGQNTSKTFEIPAHITTLTADDESANSENGSITFQKNLTVEHIAVISTKALLAFATTDSAATPLTTEFTEGAIFSQAQKITLGGTFCSTYIATAEVTAPLTFNVPVELTTNAKITTKGSPVSFENTVSKTTTQSELEISTGTSTGSIHFAKPVTVQKLTIQNPEKLTIETDATINSVNEITITGNGTISLGTENSAAELLIATENKNILFDGDRTNAKITLNSSVKMTTNTADGNITLNQIIDSKTAGSQNLTLSSGTGKIFINNSIGKTVPVGKIDVTGITQIAATIKTEDKPINFLNTVYISGADTGTTEISSGTSDITIGSSSTVSDLFISAATPTEAKNITITAGTLDVKNNIALFNGNITLNANMTAAKDIILLNGNASTMNDDTGDSSKSGVANLFDYHNTLRTSSNDLCEPSLIFKEEDPSNPGTYIPTVSKYPETMPDGTAISHTTNYNSSLSGFEGKSITALQNFYDNGVNLEAASQWTLKIKKNNSAKDSFAECYHASIKNIYVECTTAGNYAWLSASEDCTDNGGNNTDVNNTLTYNSDGTYIRQMTGIAFKHPVLLTSTASISASEGRPVNPEVPNLSGTYTVRDNVIRVEFVRSDSHSKLCLIENSNNEIRKAVHSLQMLKYNGDSSTSIYFEDVFIDAECTDTTDGKGDIAVIYLKAPDSARWNYSATGTAYGADTDSNGVHQSRYNDIEITRALSTVFYTLTDEHKNRIGSFKGTPSGENADEGFRFTATASRCAIQQMHIAFSIADFTSNKVYLYFDHPLADDITWSTLTKDSIHFYSDVDTQDTSYIVDSVEPHTGHPNGIILNLNKDLDYSRSKLQYGIKIEYGASFLFVNKIHSPDNKVVITGESHCISDVITNCIEVEYAYDNRNDAYIDSTGGIAPADSIAIRDFAALTKHNKVFADKDITLVTKDISQNLNASGESNFSYHLVADITPTLHSEGENFTTYSGNKTRAWFPVTALGAVPLEGFAPVLNNSTNLQTSHGTFIDRNFDASTLTTTFLFHNFSEQAPCLNWQSGSDVRFFFEVQDASGTIEINHLYDGSSITEGTRMTPLYTFRTVDPTDFTSIDLWSFIISEPQRQRGNVSIYSNVVNATTKEFCTLEVNMPKEGNLRVIVMTADGNIVKYLENGRQAQGLHYYYWNGTNNSGSAVARGIYFIRVVGPEIEETRKVMVVK